VTGIDPVLAELRGVFRGELEDHLTTLEQHVVTLARAEQAEEESLQTASGEIHRAVHSVKGAARAVDYPSIEELCHVVESRLAPLRRGGAREAPELITYAELVIGALRASVRSLDRGAGPDDEAIAAALARIVGASTPIVRAETVPAHGLLRETSTAERASSEQILARPRPERVEREQTARVSVARLSQLLQVAEECMTLTGRHAHDASRFTRLEDAAAELRGDLQTAHAALRAGHLADVHVLLERSLAAAQDLVAWKEDRIRREQLAWLGATTLAAELVARTRALRLVTFGSLIPPLERAVLEAARALGRTVALEIDGAGLELDRHALEGLREPLLHLVRNAVDHGIEPPEERRALLKPSQGVVHLTARLAGREAVITVRDDGRGIDPAAVLAMAHARGLEPPNPADERAIFALLFEAGFSLHPDVTVLSGRGVGLDVVRERLAELHGRIDVASTPGRGSSFALTVPIDLSVVRGLVARVGDVHVVLISSTIVQLVRVQASDLSTIDGHLYLPDPAAPIPLADLDETLGYPRRIAPAVADEERARPCVVVAAGDRRAALRVDELVDERELMIKSGGPRMRRAAFVAGATILSDGEVALILSTADLVDALRPARPASPSEDAKRRSRVLVVDDSVTARHLERGLLESAGYDVVLASSGQRAWELLASGEPFDLVVSDLEMPELGGLELLARVRSSPELHALPVVLLTALATDEDRERALRLGATAYLTKGAFNQRELLRVIELVTKPPSERP
jgi:two-component system chemotaxis sensor kinase CheA